MNEKGEYHPNIWDWNKGFQHFLNERRTTDCCHYYVSCEDLKTSTVSINIQQPQNSK